MYTWMYKCVGCVLDCLFAKMIYPAWNTSDPPLPRHLQRICLELALFNINSASMHVHVVPLISEWGNQLVQFQSTGPSTWLCLHLFILKLIKAKDEICKDEYPKYWVVGDNRYNFNLTALPILTPPPKKETLTSRFIMPLYVEEEECDRCNYHPLFKLSNS